RRRTPRDTRLLAPVRRRGASGSCRRSPPGTGRSRSASAGRTCVRASHRRPCVGNSPPPSSTARACCFRKKRSGVGALGAQRTVPLSAATIEGVVEQHGEAHEHHGATAPLLHFPPVEALGRDKR